MGAHYQPMGHVQMIMNMYDYGMDIQARSMPPASFHGDNTVIERGLRRRRSRAWKTRGHNIVVVLMPWAARRRSGSTATRCADRRLRAAQGRPRAWVTLAREALARLDARRLDHLGPLRVVLGDEFGVAGVNTSPLAPNRRKVAPGYSDWPSR